MTHLHCIRDAQPNYDRPLRFILLAVILAVGAAMVWAVATGRIPL